jgi:hypothetical protein
MDIILGVIVGVGYLFVKAMVIQKLIVQNSNMSKYEKIAAAMLVLI